MFVKPNKLSRNTESSLLCPMPNVHLEVFCLFQHSSCTRPRFLARGGSGVSDARPILVPRTLSHARRRSATSGTCHVGTPMLITARSCLYSCDTHTARLASLSNVTLRFEDSQLLQVVSVSFRLFGGGVHSWLIYETAVR